jgi:hypothetical protein
LKGLNFSLELKDITFQEAFAGVLSRVAPSLFSRSLSRLLLVFCLATTNLIFL